MRPAIPTSRRCWRETSALAPPVFDRLDDAERSASASCRSSWQTTAITSRSPTTSRTPIRRSACNYHRPSRDAAAASTTAVRSRQRLGHQRRSRTASPTRRSPSCSRSRCRSATRRRAHAAGAARHARTERASDSEPRCAGITAPAARSTFSGLPRAGRQSSRRGARRADAGAAATRCDQALNLGIGRAAYEAALDYAQLRVQGGAPHHRAPGDRREARRNRHQARGRARRDLAGRLGLRPSRGIRRPQPRRPAAHQHRQGLRVGGDLPRRQGRGGMLRRHGRDARHAVAEIRARRARSASIPATATATPSLRSPKPWRAIGGRPALAARAAE